MTVHTTSQLNPLPGGNRYDVLEVPQHVGPRSDLLPGLRVLDRRQVRRDLATAVHVSSLINPGPVDEIRQDNAHRAGAPNHLQTSGEIPMVGTNAPAADLVMADQIRATITNPALRPTRRNYAGDVIGTDFHALAENLAWALNATHPTQAAPRAGAERGAA